MQEALEKSKSNLEKSIEATQENIGNISGNLW